MGFPHDYLHEGEDLILDLKPHWWTFARPVAYTVGALVLLVLLSMPGNSFLFWLGVLVLLVALGNLGIEYGQWATTHFVLSSERLIFRSGVLSKSGIEIPLDRVNNVNFRQQLFERIIGAGDLLIESAGESGQSRFSDVRKPDAVQNEIYRQVEDQRGRATGYSNLAHPAPPVTPPPAPEAAAPPPPASPSRAPAADTGSSIARKIEELDELRRKGLVTPEEFEAKRRELLDRM